MNKVFLFDGTNSELEDVLKRDMWNGSFPDSSILKLDNNNPPILINYPQRNDLQETPFVGMPENINYIVVIGDVIFAEVFKGEDREHSYISVHYNPLGARTDEELKFALQVSKESIFQRKKLALLLKATKELKYLYELLGNDIGYLTMTPLGDMDRAITGKLISKKIQFHEESNYGKFISLRFDDFMKLLEAKEPVAEI